MYITIRQCIVLALSVVCLSIIAQKPKLYPVQIATGFTRPTDIKHCNDTRLFIVNQNGVISIMSKSGIVNSTPFLDITAKVNSLGNEQGLLGLAFSPNYKSDGYFFVNYTGGTSAGFTVIARYSVDPTDSNKALPGSELILLQFTQPFTNHNGGNMMFGKDGYLYISQGDGGSGGDPSNYAQNKNVYLGKMLRIDPFTGVKYSIPASNPLVGQTSVKEEIWSLGLRNPWRCSFDRITGDMWIADVGQNIYEEIDFQAGSSSGGENYGWRCYEATSNYNTGGCGPLSNYTSPVFSYPHNSGNGCSVTGGYVYRGSQYNNMFGRYFFTDFCSGRIWSTRRTGTTTFVTDTIGSFTKNDYSAFGEDDAGELYLTGNSSGRIWRLTDTSSCKPVAFFSIADTLVSCGSTLKLKALTGSGLTYQWQLNSSDIGGETSSSLTASSTGIYSVIVTKGACSTTSKTTYVKLNDCTGIYRQIKNSSFAVYPNPNNGTITIEIDPAKQSTLSFVEFRLYSIAGQLICAKKLTDSKSSFDLASNGVANGVYYFVIASPDAILRQDKLVVIR